MWKDVEKKHIGDRSQPLRDGDRTQTRLTRSTTLDWQILRDVEPWESQVAMPESVSTAASPAGKRIRGIRAIAVVFVALVMGAALYLWRTAESGAELLEDELRATVAAEQWLPPYTRNSQYGSDLPAPAANVKVQDIAFYGNVASVQVETTYTEPDGQTSKSRQRTFYQPTATGWVHVPPISAYLGSLQVHETEFFTFIYYSMDEAAVEGITAKLDTVYTGLRNDYGLPPTTERMVVELTMDSSKVEFVHYRANHLYVPSPSLASLPTGFLESEALQLWLLNALIYQIHRDALEKSPLQYEWHYLEVLLPSMQIRRQNYLVASWQKELVRWLYDTATRTPRPDKQLLAHELANLCNAHQIRARQTFFAGAVPTALCVAPSEMDLWYLAYYRPPEQLGQLFIPDPDLRQTEVSWTGILDMAMLLDYMDATYGHEALPALVEGFRHYGGWSTLIPAVFDVSAEELERGWQGYLLTLQ